MAEHISFLHPHTLKTLGLQRGLPKCQGRPISRNAMALLCCRVPHFHELLSGLSARLSDRYRWPDGYLCRPLATKETARHNLRAVVTKMGVHITQCNPGTVDHIHDELFRRSIVSGHS